ncbi:hypothetical protein CROQUDRAFT_649599 [Cronartium quercuum f. sp. fusiforme G11]|uniref:Uncharacterized protein n=1 Tax=Cronartium quercuum f. sp. fusiforme G11 TaxID=708437 RepID=A0A9P6NDI8_9BASI|nr:hypothetical protein CROQUDRAFT_649599 [Cronartium quercuum f. sp. fusiforme G11]
MAFASRSLSFFGVSVTEANHPTRPPLAKTKSRPRCKTESHVLLKNGASSLALVNHKRADLSRFKFSPARMPQCEGQDRFSGKVSGRKLLAHIATLSGISQSPTTKAVSQTDADRPVMIDSSSGSEESSPKLINWPEATVKNSMNLEDFSGQLSPGSPSEPASSTVSSEIAMNYNYTPSIIRLQYAQLYDSQNTSLLADDTKSTPPSSFTYIGLVGEKPGYVNSPYLAPNRDLSHGLPYPFQEPDVENSGIQTLSMASESKVHIKSLSFKAGPSPRAFLPPRILSKKIRSKFHVKSKGKQVHLYKSLSGEVVFADSLEQSDLALESLGLALRSLSRDRIQEIG